MKKKIFSILLTAALAASASSCGAAGISKSPVPQTTEDSKSTEIVTEEQQDAVLDFVKAMLGGEKKNPIYDPENVIYDQLYSTSEKNVELVIFCVGGAYLSFAEKDKGDYYAWKLVEGVAPGELDIPDGGFARINADVTWLSGGVAGFMGNPQIDRVISTEPAALDELITYCGIEEYDPQSESPVYNRPLVYKDYLFIDLYGECHVYREGKLVGTYGTELEAQAAMGIVEELSGDIEMNYLHDVTMYVFRCGDKYICRCTMIFMNDFWTTVLDREYRNLPTGCTLNDGEAACMYADVTVLNGGDAGYVNVPVVMSVRNVEENIDYGIISTDTGMPPFWGADYTEKFEIAKPEGVEISEPSDTNNAFFDRYKGTWLMFFIDEKYYIYRENNCTRELVGVYDTFEEADAHFGRKGAEL